MTVSGEGLSPTEQARARSNNLGRHGDSGTIEIAVPALKIALGPYGNLDFLANLDTYKSEFTQVDRMQLIDQLILSLDEFYVHRDLKWARHAVDAGRALRALRRDSREDPDNPTEKLSDLEFHVSVARIIKSLRDIHTAYVLPSPYRRLVAFLPFTLGACQEPEESKPRIVVNDLLEDFSEGPFQLGAEVLTWNGQPIVEAVKSEGLRECAANPAAQFALGVRLMTIRWLGTSLPPSAHWVTLSYLDPEGVAREIRFSWRLLELTNKDDLDMQLSIQAVSKIQNLGKLEKNIGANPSLTQAMDPRSEIESAAEYVLFGAGADRADPALAKDLTDGRGQPVARVIGEPINDGRPQFFRATIREATVGDKIIKFGHFRIYGFNMTSVSSFVKRFRRILRQLPPDYLIIDIRSNPGGTLNIAECLMQLLTPNQVEPLPFQFRATREVERLVDNDGEEPVADLAPWIPRVANSVANGQQYSMRGELTDKDKANLLGQEYYGTVALLIDGITYSTGDIFAAHFADLDIGPIFGTDATTGGGGGNMIYQKRVSDFAPPGLGVAPLPRDAHLHFAVRRYRRTGEGSGQLVEEQGVAATEEIRPTLDDLMNNDRRFLRRVVGEMVTRYRRRSFKPELEITDEAVSLKIQTDTGDDVQPLMLHVYVDDLPSPNGTGETDANGRATVVAYWNRQAPIHMRVEAYEQTTDAFGIRRSGKLVALYNKIIRPNGKFEEGIFS